MSIQKILMDRDGITLSEANEIVADAKEQLDIYMAEDDMSSGFDICEEFFGLEPDYLEELLPM